MKNGIQLSRASMIRLTINFSQKTQLKNTIYNNTVVKLCENPNNVICTEFQNHQYFVWLPACWPASLPACRKTH